MGSHSLLTGSRWKITSMIPKKRTQIAALLAVIFLSLGIAACAADETDTEAAESVTDSDATDEASNTNADTESGSESETDSEDSASITEVVAATDSDYLASYTLADEEFGTMVTVTVDGETRSIETNAIPDHATGEFPNSGNPNTISEQELSYSYPVEGTYTGDATFAMVPGVAVNGVSFEPGTGESVSCGSGETYRIEALQDLYNLGLDFNNAHVQPGGKYHYHGVSDLLVGAYESDEDLVHVGFAADGFLMYYSKSGAYESGYGLSSEARSGTDCIASGPAGGDGVDLEGTTPDGTYVSDWVYVDGAGDLDSCNGTTIDGEYAYIVTDEYPYITRCLNGEFTGGGPGGGAGQGGAPDGATGTPPTGGSDEGAAPTGGPGQSAPDLSEAAEALGVTEQELLDALGGPPPDFEAAAETLGVTLEELTELLPEPGGTP